MERKFEAHITVEKAHGKGTKALGELFGWKFSEIDGDAQMGAKPFAYLTQYNKDVNKLKADMEWMHSQLEEEGVPVLRTKIEEILFDSKTGLNNIEV